MEEKAVHIYIRLLFLLLCLSNITYGEQGIKIFSDRTTYVSGEKIWFECYVPSSYKSKIVYVDLKAFNGNNIPGGVKLLVENSHASGCITIPDSLKTGSYLLCTFIQNGGIKQYHCRDILVANRFDNSLASNLVNINKLPKDTTIKYSNDLEIFAGTMNTIRSNYILKVKLNKELLTNLSSGLSFCISAANKEFKSGGINFSAIGKQEICPDELNGSILTGRVVDKHDSQAVENSVVYLSVPDSMPGFSYCNTGKDGLFHFLLKDVYGELPLVIQALKSGNNENLRIILNEKFEPIGHELAPSKYFVSQQLVNKLIQAVEYFTLNKIFSLKEGFIFKKLSSIEKHQHLFYGKPDFILIPELYFDLPDFEQISKELLTGVRFRVQDGPPDLHLTNKADGQFFKENPLLLVDGVPVQDLNIIKDWGSTDIKCIHVVNAHRFYGDLEFSGVLAIYTSNFDLDWLSETERLKKVEYTGLQIKENPDQSKPTANNIPDLRSVLLWKLNCKISEEITFNFDTSDRKGDFKIVIRALKNNGEIIQNEKYFTVK